LPATTIFIENKVSFIWDNVLEKRYGKVEDKGIHGFHWTNKEYSFEDLSGCNIFLRKYHEPKNDKSSKIVIQGNFKLTVAFVTDELPKIYKAVHEIKRSAIGGEVDDISIKLKVLDIQKACGHCDFKTLQKSEVDEHVNKSHQDKVQDLPHNNLTQKFQCKSCVEISLGIEQEVNENLKIVAQELDESRVMINSEIVKNEKKQQKIEELEELLKNSDNETNSENVSKKELETTKAALDRAKDVIIEYKSQVSRLTKEKESEIEKVKVEKLKLEEDL
jgi:hypothetical protein